MTDLQAAKELSNDTSLDSLSGEEQAMAIDEIIEANKSEYIAIMDRAYWLNVQATPEFNEF